MKLLFEISKPNRGLDLIPDDPLRFIEFRLRKDGVIKYNIHKKHGDTTVNYGRFDTIHEAMAERDLLEQYDWNYSIVCNLDERENNETIYLNQSMGVEL